MKFKNSFNGGPKGIIIGVVVTVLLLGVLVALTNEARVISKISYKEFLESVRADKIKVVEIGDASSKEVEGLTVDNKRFQTTIPSGTQEYALLDQHNVDMRITAPDAPIGGWNMIIFIIMGIAGIAAVWYVARQNKNGSNKGGAGGGIFGIGKSRARMFKPSEIKEKFTAVAGAQEAKEELQDLVNFLKRPDKFRKLGAQINRGVLLVGQPGTGKTLLARAVAGEANCPFFSVSGSDFIEVFVGVGAARVRDLFAQARKNAPCIVFIDEIDAVGRQRGSGLGGGNDEREQTLNQLLTEMDGFEVNEDPVIVLAATNRADVLDKALLRPGRFDRQIEVPMPDLKSREEILQVHLKKIKAGEDIDAYKLARGVPGFTGADIANLVNEAALIACKKDLKEVTMHEFEEARDKIMLGKEVRTMVQTDNDRKITAYHEGGHALVRLLMPLNTDPLHKVTIVPRGKALGVTHFLPEREKYTSTKAELLANIAASLGGRAAEEVAFNEVTTGAYSDFQHATAIARAMVRSYGMSETLGNVVYEDSAYDKGYSETTFERIDAEVQKILDVQYKHALDLLRDNKDKLDMLAHALLEKETMYASEVYELLGITPRENLKLVE